MNRSMAAKFDKAKKCAIHEMIENENMRSCATRAEHPSKSMLWNMKYKPNYSIAKKVSLA